MTKILFILFLCFACDTKAQMHGQTLIDSFIRELPKNREDTNKVKILEKISFRYSTVNADEGLKYGKQALALSQKLPWEKGEAMSFNAIGVNYMMRGDYALAEENFKQSGKLYEKIGFKQGIATSYGNLGIVYHDMNQPAKALEAYSQSLEKYAKICFRNGIANQMNNIGNIYLDMADYSKALVWFKRSLEISRAMNNRFYMAIRLNNCSYVYRCQGYLDSAKISGNEALEISKEIGDQYCLSLSYKNLGAIYLEEKDLSKAGEYFRKSLQMGSAVNSRHRIEVAIGYLGLNHLAMVRDTMLLPYQARYAAYKTPGTKDMVKQDYINLMFLDSVVMVTSHAGYPLDSAIWYLDSAIRIGEELHEQFYVMGYHHALFEAYALAGDMNNAIKHNEIYQRMKAAYFPEEEQKQIRKMGEGSQHLLMVNCN